jgi:hypothetical protein
MSTPRAVLRLALLVVLLAAAAMATARLWAPSATADSHRTRTPARPQEGEGDDGDEHHGNVPAKADKKQTQTGTLTGSKRCLACHMDFEEEKLTREHMEHGVGCLRCHGTSQAHVDDKLKATPPDAVFRDGSMKVFCLACHDPARHAAMKPHATEAAAAKKAGKPERVCTACHGEHKLVRGEDTDQKAAPKPGPKH